MAWLYEATGAAASDEEMVLDMLRS
jgi:hypothetical protein